MRRRRVSTGLALVAGAGGFLGTAVCRELVERGWTVRGLVRTGGGARRARSAGARPVAGSVLEASVVRAASRGCQLLVHLAATGGPTAERTRVVGARNLAAAARANGVRRIVIGSGYWVYADNPGVITERSRIDARGESLINLRTEQAARRSVDGGSVEVLIVRPGMVYGDGSWFRSVVHGLARGTYRYIGTGSNPWSFVSRQDAGTAFATIAESGRPGAIYNVVDGRPTPWREFAEFVAARLDRPPPGTISPSDAEAEFGPDVAHHLAARRACSPKKLSRLGWRPQQVDFREGIAALLPQMSRRA